MSTTLVEQYIEAKNRIVEEIAAYRDYSPDTSAFDEALADVQFNREWDREVGGFPMSDAFEFARSNQNEFDSMAAEYSVSYDGDIINFISRVYEWVLYQRYSQEFAESQRNAEFAFSVISQIVNSLLAEAQTADAGEFGELKLRSMAEGFDWVLPYLLSGFEEAIGLPILGAVLDSFGTEIDDLEDNFDRLEVEGEEFLLGTVSREAQSAAPRNL
jgi:hypothetical protein